MQRILTVTELNGLNPSTNSKFWMCTRASELLERGFIFEKDQYDGEPDEHYSVIIGDPPTIQDAERFVDAFKPYNRGNPT